jgi:hypothetical protein
VLSLFETKLGDASVKELAGLKELRMLRLGDTDVTDEGLKALTGLK